MKKIKKNPTSTAVDNESYGVATDRGESTKEELNLAVNKLQQSLQVSTEQRNEIGRYTFG